MSPTVFHLQGETLAEVLMGLVLVLFALGVLVQVLLASREQKLSFKGVLSVAGASLWAIPVLAVLAFYGYRVFEANTYQRKRTDSVERDREADGLPFQPATQSVPRWVTKTHKRYKNGKLEQVVISARGARGRMPNGACAGQTAELLRKEYPGEAEGLKTENVER